MTDWVETQASGGRYSNASDYVRDLVHRDQERARQISEWQALMTEGIESGVGDQNMADILAEARVATRRAE